MTRRPRIAWFSPLEGFEDTASASMTRLMLPHLSVWCDVTLFGAHGHSSEQRHFLSAFELHRKSPFDLFWYQLEDRQCSNFARMHLALLPGITWFHEFFLTTAGPEPMLNSPWSEVVELFHGRRNGWMSREKEYRRELPQALREAAMSFLPILSTPRDHNEWRRLNVPGLGRDSELLRHPVPARLFDTAAPSGARRVAFCGTARIESRAHLFFEAYAGLASPPPCTWYVQDSTADEVERLLKDYDVTGVDIVHGTGLQAWCALASQAAVVFHPRFSTFGSVYPYLGASLALGRPAVVLDFGACQTLPKSLAFKVAPGEHEVPHYRAILTAVNNAEMPRDVPEAREFAFEFHHEAVVAAELKTLLGEHVEYLKDLAACWQVMERSAMSELLREVRAEEHGPFSAQIFPQQNSGIERAFADLGWSAP